jgi:hypothetical protein
MFATRALIVAGLLFSASAALAQNQDQNSQGGYWPTVYTTSACWDPNCFMTATSQEWPNPSPYTVFAKLTLPAGSYMLHGKLSYWTKSPTKDPIYTWGNLECFIGTPDLSQGDWSSAGVNGDSYVVDMNVPLTLRGRTTTIEIGCKLFGAYFENYWLYVPFSGMPNGELKPVEVGVWGVRLTAEQVGRVIVQ